MTQLTTLLFDLDGTLLPMDQDYFTKGYFKQLVPRFAHLIDPEAFVAQMWKSTEAMIRSEDPDMTNEHVFKKDFLTAIGAEESVYWPIFEDFYAGQFGELSHLSDPTPLARQICEAALDKGYEIVLATNPLFPRTAIEHRMRWAGVDGLPFTLVTTLEEMHFCKPNPRYYQEILHKINRSPESCMMIGNDSFEDLIAGKLGVKTYWVTDCAMENEKALPFDRKGTMEDLLRFVRDELPALR